MVRFTAAAAAAEEQRGTPDVLPLPAEVDREMLDKRRFFVVGAALFSGVSAALYPAVVLKTRLQVAQPPSPCLRAAASILRHEGPRGFYRGFATSLAGTVPARAVYMGALEATKSAVGKLVIRLGVSEPTATAAASAAAGVSAAIAAQLVWTPIDVVSQRLMVQGSSASEYRGGIDAVKKILCSDGLRGLYRGFGLSILTYAPSNAVWWASYIISQRLIWAGISRQFGGVGSHEIRPRHGAVVAVQGASAAVAGAATAVVTMPLDTIKTRLQVWEGGAEKMTVSRTIRSLLQEGGWRACYRGLGPRWASSSLSATTMITTYEFLKRLSTKDGGCQSCKQISNQNK
ncbi:solute carrier family 25 member 44-like [Zingiber officinale]|uniref:Mitochondrial carrier protein n=1 Tax=Zingiber officinale TaxID=94328 RepID=A0A8J5HHT5_ZINOF|nr:solute carrier family 25 member 44-like [Zingiber officinale]KAG6528834.1 hypothetical protein ZIOFF_011019 [Zingiber officinale]